jgi:hydrogen peroxide-dependent heme synthase
MRFDPVSAQYADFGEFYIGLQLPLDDLFRRIQL